MVEFWTNWSELPSSIPLNQAARSNDYRKVKQLLRKFNPNVVDNRGWTCLHEAAANNSYESLLHILSDKRCRPLVETHEGCTALKLACDFGSSIKIIRILLEKVKDIANYGCFRSITPLHTASSQGRTDVVNLLLKYNAIVDSPDADGDTALHDACFTNHCEVVDLLLHAGADISIVDEKGFSPVHLAAMKGSRHLFQVLYPFIHDRFIDMPTKDGLTPLMLAAGNNNNNVVLFLLEKGVNPNSVAADGAYALSMAAASKNQIAFEVLLPVTSKDIVDVSLFLRVCHYELNIENLNILDIFFNSDLLQECFKSSTWEFEPFNSFIAISDLVYSWSPAKFEEYLYLLLMSGIPIGHHSCEWPTRTMQELIKDHLEYSYMSPLACVFLNSSLPCCHTLVKFLLEHGCDVDQPSNANHDDHSMCNVFSTAKAKADIELDALYYNQFVHELPLLLQYSLRWEPWELLKDWSSTLKLDMKVEDKHAIAELVYGSQLQNVMLGIPPHLIVDTLCCNVPPLKHLCRIQIRDCLRKAGVKGTTNLLIALQLLPLPKLLQNYLRYM